MSKTLQGYRIKLKRKKEKKTKTKQQNRRQSVVAGRQQLYCAVQSRLPNHCRTMTEKVQSSTRDGTSSATVHSWRRRQAVPRTCRSHWEGTVTECWTSSGRYHQHGWISRAQTTSSVDVRCPVQALSKVRRRFSIKTAVISQNAQPECDSLRNSQPMEFTKQLGYAFWPPRWVNQTGGGIQDGLQSVLQLAGNTITVTV